MERAPGGKSWADSMFRHSADNQQYIKTILNRTQLVEKTIRIKPEKPIKAYFGEDDFILLYEGKIVMRQSYHYVDCCRGKSAFDFDEEIKKLLKHINEGSNHGVSDEGVRPDD